MDLNYFDLDLLCALTGVRVLSYDAGAEAIRRLHLERLASRAPGVACVYNGERIIFFDNTRPVWAVHFAIAKCLALFRLGCLDANGPLARRELLRADLYALWLLFQINRQNPRFFRDIARAGLTRRRGTGAVRTGEGARG